MNKSVSHSVHLRVGRARADVWPRQRNSLRSTDRTPLLAQPSQGVKAGCTARPLWPAQRLPGRWAAARQLLTVPSRMRHRVAHGALSDGDPQHSHAPSLDSQIRAVVAAAAGVGGRNGRGAAGSASASAASSTWLAAGRQWLSRAACCTLTGALALSLILSSDPAAAAAAAASAPAATQPALIRSGSEPQSQPTALLLPSGDRLLWSQPGAEPGGADGSTPSSHAVSSPSSLSQPQAEVAAPGASDPQEVRREAGLSLSRSPGAAPGVSATFSSQGYNLGRPPSSAAAPAAPLGPPLVFTFDGGRTLAQEAPALGSRLGPRAPVSVLGVGAGSGALEDGPGVRPWSAAAAAGFGGGRLEGEGGSGSGVMRRGPGGGARSDLDSDLGLNLNLNLDLASETEDRLLEVARQVEARVEGVLGALAGGVPQLLTGPEAKQDASTAAAHSLIREVWEVVDNYYLDARATGFDRQQWAELRDAALAVPYRDTAAGYRAVRDMLARGLSDPYCRFIGPPELEAMKKYDVSGVGLNLGTAAEYVVKTGNELPGTRDPAAGEGVYVVGVSKGSTADVAGIRQGDELLAIQGRSLESTTPFRAAGLISGSAEETSEGSSGGGGGEAAARAEGPTDATAAAATASSSSSSSADRQQQPQQQQRRRKGGPAEEDVVRVTVRHPGGEEEEVALVRPRRTLPSAVSSSLTRSAVLLPGGGRGEELVGTVRLGSFNARAQADVAAAIRQLEAAGATRLVLDLRDNRGGLVTEGLEVARLFLGGDAPIVITERRDAPPETPRAPGPALTSAPLLVLVNSHTASASEIVAGALHDNCRAVLAGSRTYGKGLIQSVYELSDGSGLVITVGKYLTPRGTDIDRYGIKPDFNSVPSSGQYDNTVDACKLAAAPALYGNGGLR